jgi:4-hydroxy-tetrahydrodipicolinate reductase
LGGDYQNIRIHSIRLPGFVADQDVILGGLGQRLTISHETIDRAAFMPGVVLACKKVLGISELVYGLENLL